MRVDGIVHGYVDAALSQLRRSQLMATPDPRMPPAMYDPSFPPELDWRGWKAITSTVTDDDLDELEAAIKLSFPPSYRAFLKYKHFYALTESGVRFEPHVVGRWKRELSEAYRAWEPERIVRAGLIPFGDEAFLDAGPVCFDTGGARNGGEYPVVFWDHEWIGTENEVQPMFSSSLKMFEALRYVAEQDTNFFYIDEEDGPGVVAEKARLLRGFLAVDPTGAGGTAKGYWTAFAAGAEI